MKNKPVDCYSSHYLTIKSSLKYIFPREATFEKNLDYFIHSGEICPQLSVPFLQGHQLLTSAARVALFSLLIGHQFKTVLQSVENPRSGKDPPVEHTSSSFDSLLQNFLHH